MDPSRQGLQPAAAPRPPIDRGAGGERQRRGGIVLVLDSSHQFGDQVLGRDHPFNPAVSFDHHRQADPVLRMTITVERIG